MSVCLYSYLSSMQRACAVLYCHLWPVRLSYIFQRYLKYGSFFEKIVLNTKCVF